MPVTVELEFFYDCSSPWTYFAFTRIIPMMERLEVPIRWRPILVGGVFNAVNQEVYAAREAMFNDSNSLRLNYYIKDMQDWERLCGVRAQMPPGHPISSVKAMRGVFFAQEQGLLVPYSKAVFETYWAHMRALSDWVPANDFEKIGSQAIGLVVKLLVIGKRRNKGGEEAEGGRQGHQVAGEE